MHTHKKIVQQPRVRFAFLADPQFGLYQMLSKILHKPWGKKLLASSSINLRYFNVIHSLHREKVLYQEAIDRVNDLTPRPNFTMVCGDMVNDYNRPDELHALRSISKSLHADIPLYWTPGNHDTCVDNIITDKQPVGICVTPTPASIANYRKNFGKDYYDMSLHDIHMIVINSTVLNNAKYVKDEYYANLKFLESSIDKANKNHAKQIIIFSHHPWINGFDNKKENDGHESLLNVLSSLKKVIKKTKVSVFSGHMHWNQYNKIGNITQYVCTSVGCTFAQDPSGFYVVDVYSDSIKVKYIKLASGIKYFNAGPYEFEYKKKSA